VGCCGLALDVGITHAAVHLRVDADHLCARVVGFLFFRKPIPFFGKRYMFLRQKVYVLYLYMSGGNAMGGYSCESEE